MLLVCWEGTSKFPWLSGKLPRGVGVGDGFEESPEGDIPFPVDRTGG